MASEARRRFYQFFVPCQEGGKLNELGTWNGTGYDIYSETPVTVKAMMKHTGCKDVIGIADVEMELRKSIDTAKKGHTEALKRGSLLLKLIGEDGTDETILLPTDRLAIKAYRNSIKAEKKTASIISENHV